MKSFFEQQKFYLFIILTWLTVIPVFADFDKDVTIGIVFDGPWEKNSEIWATFRNEIIEHVEDEFEIQFPQNKMIESDYSKAGITESINQLLADPEVDLVITMGIIGSHVVSNLGKLSKPVIAPFILDHQLQSIPFSKGESGVKNLNYVSRIDFIENNIFALREVVDFNKIALLIDPNFMSLIPSFENVVEKKLLKLEIQHQIISTQNSADEILAALDNNVQAVYIDGLVRFNTEKSQKLIAGLINRKIPSISASGTKDVEKGIMMSQSSTDLFIRRARRVAVNVQRILIGDDPEEIPVAYSEPKRITININTAKSIGIFPSWELITGIVLIGDEVKEKGPVISLFTVVREALELNLDLKAQSHSVNSGEKEVGKAWSNLLPQVEVSATGLQIDKDRAKSSFGSQAERTISGSVTVSQILFSEQVMGNVTIQKELQISREQEFESLRLDLIQEVAIAYLNILRAKTFERIQADNLKVSQTNYETAKIRESIGSAGPGEVYRWEAEVASGQQAVILATVQREIAEQALNRILGYPLTRKFTTEETDVNDERLITSKGQLFEIINNPWAYEVFSNFLTEEALKVSPEIKALDAAIAAQERYYSSTGRSIWLPSLAAQAQYDNVFDRSGEGSEVESAGLGMSFSPPKDRSWSVVLNASLPIFSGGSKYISRQQAYIDLQKLKTERESVRQKIDQRTKLALKNSRYSGASIRLSKKAADAAKKNLEIVTDAYGGGAISIIELLDAQNAALVTDQVASSAAFDFLIDIMNVERAVGRFDFFLSDKEQEAWVEKFEAYYNESMNR